MKRLSCLLAIALAGCSYVIDYDPPTPSATSTATTTATTAPTATASLAPSQTPTETPTATETITPTATPAIIEVTPLGGVPTISAGQKVSDIEGEYMPFGALNIRACAYVDVGCAVVGQLSGQVAVPVYAMVVVYPAGDVWLCIDPGPAEYVSSECNRVVALVIAGKEYGSLVLD